MKTKKIVFYDHNCKICTCFSTWVKNRTDYWVFVPNDPDTVNSSELDIDEKTAREKIICFDDKKYLGAIAILKIYTKCGGVLGTFTSLLFNIKLFYPLYAIGYFLFSKNRSKFSFMVRFIDC